MRLWLGINMVYVADLNPLNSQVISLRVVGNQCIETPTIINVSDEQYQNMKDDPISWHFDATDGTFKKGMQPAPSANNLTMGGLDLAKYNAKMAVSAFSEELRNMIVGGASMLEVAGWTRYVQLAAKFDAGTLTALETQTLAFECELRKRGETVEQLISKVKANDIKYTAAQAAINGMIKAAVDEINAASSIEQVDSVLAALKTQAQARMTGG